LTLQSHRHHQIGAEQLGKGHFMNAEVAAFLDSVTTGNPPAMASPLLRSVWHGLRGEWEAAHQIAQEDTSAEGAWVHAWLHRIEGDLANAVIGIGGRSGTWTKAISVRKERQLLRFF
jgi:hypothetical protein